MSSPALALASVCHAYNRSLEMGVLVALVSGYLGVVKNNSSQQGSHVSKLVLPALEYLLRGLNVWMGGVVSKTGVSMCALTGL